MFGSWLGVALMTSVVVAGFIASLMLSKNSVQKKASMGAFSSLALLLVLFFITILIFSLEWVLPILIVSCIIIPIIIYAAILAGSSTRQPSKGPRLRSADSTVRPVAVGPSASKRAHASIAPARKAIALQQGATSSIKVKPAKIETPVFASAGRHAAGPKVTPEAKTVIVEEPALHPIACETQEETALPPKPFEPLPYETCDNTDTVQDLVPEAAPLCEAPDSQYEGVHDSGTESGPRQDEARIAYTACYSKADAFKEKGLFPIASRLYAECAHLSDDRADARNALFAAMGCFVKADEAEEAKKVAQLLQEDIDSLSVLEVLKLDAVLRMP